MSIRQSVYGAVRLVCSGRAGKSCRGRSGARFSAIRVEPLEERRLLSVSAISDQAAQMDDAFGPSAGAQISGAVYNDLDGNGDRDAGEPGLPDWTVYLDENGNGAYDGDPITEFASVDVPKHLSSGTIESVLEVPAGAGTILDVNVIVDIEHTWDSHLEAFLIGPDATRVELFTAVGGASDNFSGTVLDDEATTPITSGQAPFSGSYQPEGTLTDFDGKSADGTWTLEVTDTYGAFFEGDVLNWSLEITTPGEVTTTTDTNGDYVFADLAPGTYEVGAVWQPGWRQTEPVAATHTLTLVADQVAEGIDIGYEVTTTGDIQGTKWNDADGDGEWDAEEEPLAGWEIYLDLNDNGEHDTNEPKETTDASGAYRFQDVLAGTYVVREIAQDGYEQTNPGPAQPTFWGAAYLEDTGQVQLCWIDPVTGTVTRAPELMAERMHGMVVTNDGRVFGISGWDDSLYEIDPVSGAISLIGASGWALNFGLAYDSATDTIYGAGRPSDSGYPIQLITIDRTDGSVTPIGPGIDGPSGVSDLTFDPVNRRIILFANNNDQFYAFDTLGNGSLISSAAESIHSWSMAYYNGGVAMGLLNDRNDEIAFVDPDTGAVTGNLELSENAAMEAMEVVYRDAFAHRVTVVAGGVTGDVDFGNHRKEDLQLEGTAGDDTIAVWPGVAGVSLHRVSINGVTTTYDPAVYHTIHVDGLGGNDRVNLHGLDDSDDAFYGEADASRIEIGSTGFVASADNCETVYGFAGTAATAGGDRAYLAGTAADDTFVASDGSGYISGGGLLLATRQFDYVEADVAESGGTDKAYFNDTAGDDDYHGEPPQAWIELSSGVTNKAVGFSQTRATSSGSETNGDRAFLTGADGQDKFIARFDIGYMFGTGYLNSAAGFDYVQADVSGTTGDDWAYFVGTAGDDAYYGAVDESRMELSNGVVNKSIGFPNHYALAEGHVTGDSAYLTGSTGDDVFVAGDGYGYVFANGAILNSTRGFETVEATVTSEGNDIGGLYDTAGVDLFYGGVDESRMELSTGIVNTALGAFDTVYAYGSAGTGDEAYLTGTAGNDTFVGRDGSAYLSGSGKVNSIRRFDYVEADVSGSGGSDTATLHDSSLVDLLTADGDEASFDHGDDGDLELMARGFARVNANSTEGGPDKKDDDQALNFVLVYYGDQWE